MSEKGNFVVVLKLTRYEDINQGLSAEQEVVKDRI